MRATREQVRHYRLQAHHLDKKLPPAEMQVAAGACGIQNSPPGAWETALYNRLENCTLENLHTALYTDKTLVQAWSFRGVPVIFPTDLSDVFLTPLIAQKGEQPWIYTRGISGALDHLGLSFDEVLQLTQEAARYLDTHIIKSKEVLDQTLDDLIEVHLPQDKQALWRDPSPYGRPDRQTVGGAAVSFMLRPCSYNALVVFGKREGSSPTFTSFKNWIGHPLDIVEEAEQELVRKFLHCYGPATLEYFMSWLGCSKPQARRLWATVSEEMVSVEIEGKPHYLLHKDCTALMNPTGDAKSIMLLGAHDPYLDVRDKVVILEDKARQKTIWQFVSNPGVVLKGGRVAGIWRVKTLKEKLDITVTLWDKLNTAEQNELKQRVEEYAAFRLLNLRTYTLEHR